MGNASYLVATSLKLALPPQIIGPITKGKEMRRGSFRISLESQ